MDNSKRESNVFDYGETAKVRKISPEKFRPGAIVSICGMTKINSNDLAARYDSPIGAWVYTIEYIGGADTEIPECYLEKWNDQYDA